MIVAGLFVATVLAVATPTHCSYTAVVVSRDAFTAYGICTARMTRLRLSADRPFLVDPSAQPTRGGDFFVCNNTPVSDRASRIAICEGSVRAGVRVDVRATTTSLCRPIHLRFDVTAPFPNGASLTLRARCA